MRGRRRIVSRGRRFHKKIVGPPHMRVNEQLDQEIPWLTDIIFLPREKFSCPGKIV